MNNVFNENGTRKNIPDNSDYIIVNGIEVKMNDEEYEKHLRRDGKKLNGIQMQFLEDK